MANVARSQRPLQVRLASGVEFSQRLYVVVQYMHGLTGFTIS